MNKDSPEAVSAPSSGQPDFTHDEDIAPKSLDDFHGQERGVKYLRHIIKSAKIRRKALGHILFSGPPGLGKTALANTVAHEMGTRMVTLMAPAVTSTMEIAHALINLNPGDILFLDEIHALDRKTGEVFYTAIQDFRLVLGEEMISDLNPFTLIGATTAPGHIDTPLHERFSHRIELVRYNEEELIRIIRRAAGKLDLHITDSALRIMAASSQGTPRQARHLVNHVRDHAVNHGLSVIDETSVAAVFALVGIHEDGLTDGAIRYLDTLVAMDRAAGIRAIARTMNENAGYVENVVEPWLVYRGYVVLTRQGRVATDKAQELMKRIKNDQDR